MRITQWGEYGILFCLYLARKGDARASEKGGMDTPMQPVGAVEISNAHGIALDYTQQILHRLKRGALVKTVRGPKGGFLLNREATKISLKQVLTAAEGGTFDIVCDLTPIHDDCKSGERCCGLRAVWQELQSSIDAVLDGKSIADLVQAEKEGAARPLAALSEQLVQVHHRANRSETPVTPQA